MNVYRTVDNEDGSLWIPIATAFGRISQEVLSGNATVSLLFGMLAQGTLSARGVVRRTWKRAVREEDGKKNLPYQELVWGEEDGTFEKMPVPEYFWRHKISSDDFTDGIFRGDFEDMSPESIEDDNFVGEYRSTILDEDPLGEAPFKSSVGDPAKISDVEVNWHDIESALVSPSLQSRFALEGYTAVFDRPGGKVVIGRPRKNDEWTQWYCEVLELFLRGKFGPSTTANNIVETVSNRAASCALSIPTKSSTYPVAQAIVERVRRLPSS